MPSAISGGSGAEAQGDITEGIEVICEGDPVIPVGDVSTVVRGYDEHGTESFARDGVEQLTAHT